MPRFLAAPFLLIVTCYAQAPESATKLVITHQAWGQKASSKNATLTIQEASRSGKAITLRLQAHGLPKNVSYSLMNWPVTEQDPTETLRSITLGADGTALSSGKPVEVVVTPLPGEPVRLGLVSADRSAMAFSKLSPNPIRAEDRGCTIEATLLTSGAEVVLIEGSGFPADGDFTTQSNSEGERRTESGKAGADGRFSFAELPFKEGLAKGTIRIDIKAAQCSPSLSIDWGRRFRIRN